MTRTTPNGAVQIALGFLAPTLQKQFGHMLPPDAITELDHLQRDNEAISRLKIRNLIPSSLGEKAQKRLSTSVINLLKKYDVVESAKP